LTRTSPRSLTALAAYIDDQPDWWRFPEEPGVSGFLGAGEVFFVGDQPSTSPWPRHHPSRRLFYDGLVAAGLGDAHLTDLIKTRAKASESRTRLPHDFAQHLALFREELALLRPERVVALGELCEAHLRAHVPEVVPRLRYLEHFASAARPNRGHGYTARLAEAAGRHSPHPGTTGSPARAETPLDAGLVARVERAPASARVLRWTLRRDNNAHHHGVVAWNGGPVVLDLWWRASKGVPESAVGIFLLDLGRLLDGGFVRWEREGEHDRVRVRVVMRNPDTFALQVRTGAPAHALPARCGRG
jgi:hypothetical protein